MSGSNFDIIAREVLKQKQRMDQMLNENRELRQQLAELRAGQGIFVEIEGKRFPLISSSSSLTHPLSQENSISLDFSPDAPNDVSAITPLEEEQTQAIQQSSLEQIPPVLAEGTDDIVEAKTTAIPEVSSTRTAATTELIEEGKTSTFLEEAMIDEFTSAATSPLAVWSGPPAPHEPHASKSAEDIEEKEKALLRSQLMDSFMLG